MKLIIAIIQPDKIDEVHQSLIDAEIFRITVSRVTGHGQQEDQEIYRGSEVRPGLIPKVRLEIAVNDGFVKPTIEAIIAGARTGKIGDGKVWIVPVDDVRRIRTGEAGSDAL